MRLVDCFADQHNGEATSCDNIDVCQRRTIEDRLFVDAVHGNGNLGKSLFM